jgi:hypothetical protein
MLVNEESTTPSASELEVGTGAVAEDEDPPTSAEEFGVALLLSGAIAEELSGVTGTTGLDSSSEQAENRPRAVTQVPTASHFFVFISAFLVL